MTLPRFTAEDSLGETSERYVLGLRSELEFEGVLPQLHVSDAPTCRTVCIGGRCFDICVGMSGQLTGGGVVSTQT